MYCFNPKCRRRPVVIKTQNFVSSRYLFNARGGHQCRKTKNDQVKKEPRSHRAGKIASSHKGKL